MFHNYLERHTSKSSSTDWVTCRSPHQRIQYFRKAVTGKQLASDATRINVSFFSPKLVRLNICKSKTFCANFRLKFLKSVVRPNSKKNYTGERVVLMYLRSRVSGGHTENGKTNHKGVFTGPRFTTAPATSTTILQHFPVGDVYTPSDLPFHGVAAVGHVV